VEDLDPSQGTSRDAPPFPKASPVSIFINPPKGSVGAGSPSYIRVTPLTKVCNWWWKRDSQQNGNTLNSNQTNINLSETQKNIQTHYQTI